MSRMNAMLRVALQLMVVGALVSVGCTAPPAEPEPVKTKKDWTIGARLEREDLREDSILDGAAKVLIGAKKDGFYIDTAQEMPGLIEVRTGPTFGRLGEIHRQGLANAFIHELSQGEGTLVYVDGKTGKLLGCYKFGSRVR